MRWQKGFLAGEIFALNNFYFGEGWGKNQRKFFGAVIKIRIAYKKNNYFFAIEEGSARNLAKKIYEKVKRRPKILKKWRDIFLNKKKETEKLLNADFRKFSDEELEKLYKKLVENYQILGALATGPPEGFGLCGAEEIKKELKSKLKENSKKFQKYYFELIKPANISYVEREKVELLKIFEWAVKNEKTRAYLKKRKKGALKKYPELEKKLREHAKKFYWIHSSYAGQSKLDEQFFLSKLFEIAKKGGANKPSNKDEKEKIIEKIGGDRKLKLLTRTLDFFTKIMDEKKENLMKNIGKLYELLYEIGKRGGIEEGDMRWTTFNEQIAILEHKKIKIEKVKERKKGVVVYYGERGRRIVKLENIEQQLGKIFGHGRKAETEELRGVSASPGKVTGKVRIIAPDRIKEMERGEILIAMHTSPEFVIAMKKAKAIVTERGGATSHAAIVSRELNVPCIVGVIDVTKKLRNGDLIEVDANEGKIKILRRGDK